MTPPIRGTTIVTAISLAVLAGCRSPERRAAEAAKNTSRTAASADQRQLWQDVADKGTAPGLERVPVVQQPVEPRKRPTTGGSAPVPAQPIAIPTGVQSSIRIVDYPAEPAKSYEGPATVIDATGDFIRLDLGSKRILSVLARAGGLPIRLTKGETVRVAYLSRRAPQEQHTVIGILTTAGEGIVQVAQAGDSAIDTNVPLFNLNAKQLVSEPGAPVQVTGADAIPHKLRLGEIAKVGDAIVFIIGSAGVGQGPDVALIDGKPYALNVLVWKVP
jgi:hypothetical protein